MTTLVPAGQVCYGGVDRVTEKGLVFDGVEYEVDCIIYSTGFEALAMPYRVGEFGIYGAGGLSLEDKWSDGIKSLHSIFSHDFPNMFVLGNVRDASVASNAHFGYREQCIHAAAIIAKCVDEGLTRIEPTQEAEDAWREAMRANAQPDQFWLDCTPGYLNSEGAAGADSFRLSMYGAGSIAYAALLAEWRQTEFENQMACAADGEPPAEKDGV